MTDRGGRARVASVSAGLSTRPGAGGPPTDYAAAVLAVVRRIPPGQVLSYGDVAELVGRGTGRGVGQVLAKHGRDVDWWRVVRSDGAPAPAHPLEALTELRAEGCPVVGPRLDRVDMARARWDGG